MLEAPPYDRTEVSPGIVHLGVGASARGNHAAYVDGLLRAGLARDFGIIAVAVDPAEAKVAQSLRDQDGLYTLTEAYPDGTRVTRTIGSLVEVLFAPDDPYAVTARLRDPATRVVALTVGRDGYPLDPDTGRFDPEHPAARAGLPSESGPCSAFRLVVEALGHRRAAGVPPFTVVSCDDLPGNGDITRMVTTGLARVTDSDLATWIDANVRFPGSIVDRLVQPAASGDAPRGDAVPLLAESCGRWVLEDDFSLGRPPYERAGAQLTDNIVPHALAKLRLTDAARTALGHLGSLAGHRNAEEACHDPLLTGFLLTYLREEAAPTLPPVLGLDLAAFTDEVIERLGSSGLRTPLSDLCVDGSAAMSTLLVPVVEDVVRMRRPVDCSALIVAAWARYVEGVDEQGAPIDVVDELAEPLHAAAAAQRTDPLVLLRNPMLFGGLIDTPEFTVPYAAMLESLHTRGVRRTLEAIRDSLPSAGR